MNIPVKIINSDPLIKLAVNAGYTRDVDLLEYSFDRFCLAHPNDIGIFYSDKYLLGTAVAASILLGGLDEHTMNWMNSRRYLESEMFLLSAFDFIVKHKSTELVRYDPKECIRLIDLVSAKYLSSYPKPTTYETHYVGKILHLLSMYCLGNLDLDTEQYAKNKISKIDAASKTISDLSSRSQFFTYVMYMLVSHSTNRVVEVLEHLREKYSYGEKEYCIICYVAFDVENFGIIEWLDRIKGLRNLFSTKCEGISLMTLSSQIYYLVDQIVGNASTNPKVDQEILKKIDNVMCFNMLGRRKTIDLLENTMKHIGEFGRMTSMFENWFDHAVPWTGYSDPDTEHNPWPGYIEPDTDLDLEPFIRFRC